METHAQSSRGGSGESETAELRGVGGWLLLFCLILTVFSPIGRVLGAVFAFRGIAQFPEFYARLASGMRMTLALSIALASLGLVAGIQLWRVRRLGLVLAKIFLASAVVVAIASALAFIGADLPAEVSASLLRGGIRNAVFAALWAGVWYAYLRRSRRVAATYGAGWDRSASIPPN